MNIQEYARLLVEGECLEDKLTSINLITNYENNNYDFEVPKLPGREVKHRFSDERAKFPKRNSFHLPEKRAMALHFFANHELLAIEMMAAAILLFPATNEEEKRVQRGLLTTITDEQKHFKLYRQRMQEFGIEFGDFPLNDFFWRQMKGMKSFADFFALVSLTFEAANLDFSKLYGELFIEVEDIKTAAIMKTVYDDEITHVALGQKWLNTWRGDKTLWQYYLSLLPEKLSPSRSKGQQFDKLGRSAAGFDDDFIYELENYRDDFRVTDRRDWK